LIPQGTLPWQPVKVGPIYFVALPFPNGFKYRNSDFKRLNRMNFCTLCTILVTFGPETPEFMLLTVAPFVAIRQKSAYHVKYLRISWTYLDLLHRFGRSIGGDDYSNVRLTVAQGTLLWQPVKFEDGRRHRQERPYSSLWRSTTDWLIVNPL